MKTILFVAIGGAIGAVLRHLLAALPNSEAFPWGTLLVNLLGAFLIGVLWISAETKLLPPDLKPLLITGMLGALTTFSTYSLDNLKLIENGALNAALLNILVSNALGLLAVFLGATLTRWLL